MRGLEDFEFRVGGTATVTGKLAKCMFTFSSLYILCLICRICSQLVQCNYLIFVTLTDYILCLLLSARHRHRHRHAAQLTQQHDSDHVAAQQSTEEAAAAATDANGKKEVGDWRFNTCAHFSSSSKYS